MDIKEIKEKRDQLTRDIFRLVTKFHEETGVEVSDLGYRLLNMTTVGDKKNRYKVDLNIEIKL